jgi:penicillin G amidase
MSVAHKLGRAGLAVFALLLGTALGAVSWTYRSLPRWSGEVTVSGSQASIRIVREPNGIPHVFAENEPDAYFGLGYVHAQDRLWQLELDRRLASGRLAQIFGRDALPRDRLFRTLGFRRVAAQKLERQDAATRAVLAAYARGVNAFLAQGSPLPPEFALLGVEPEPWTEVDSLVWLEMMAWILSMNVDSELARWRLSTRLDREQLAQFLPPYPGDVPILLEPWLLQPSPGLGGGAPKRTGSFMPRAGSASGLGSNNWVVDGRGTASGKPLLANDPHLRLSSPSIWYLAHLSAPGLNVIGATLPSLPGVILGRNDSVAWAFTNTGSDTQDLFVERLAPGDPSRYLTPAGPASFELVREIIAIQGEADEVLEVRLTRHGPVISGVYEPAQGVVPEGYVLALGWTALSVDDETPRFALDAARARNGSEFLEAARHFHAPPQNMVYADTAGHIGFVAAGRMPLRHPQNAARGLWPAPGWSKESDWQGFVPFESLPAERDPASGRIVTANQKIVPPGYPHWLGADWAEPYRAERIEAMLSTAQKLTVNDFARMQLDVASGPARDLLPLLLDAMPPEAAPDPRARQLLEGLRSWNREMRASAIEPLVFAAWVRELARMIYADELGELFEEAWAERFSFMGHVLARQGGAGRWCDDVGTPQPEACSERVADAFRAALVDLSNRYGDDPSKWTWGQAHRARARHFPMTRVPLLRDLFDTVMPSDGGTHTVNVGAYAIDDADAPFESRHAAGFRAVYDLANLSASRFLINTGQSGHPLSSNYRGWALPWQNGKLVPMLTDRGAIEATGGETLVLEPRR